MIVTEKILLTNKDLFSILISNYLKKRWWLFAWIWIMILILLFRENNDKFDYLIVAALVAIQLLIVFQYWGIANAKDVQERYYEIDSDKIIGTTIGGTITSIENGLLIKVVKTSKYYLLYTTKIEFICLPISSFKNSEDREWFENEAIAKIRK
ncbi:MAG: hypothetical protein EHM93_15525 [Bacteroidales bacterium]|nr:MAG: hypothetical protein EHM93_15525 [Bacteroidales bacterium]